MNTDIQKLNIDKQYYQLFVDICIRLYNQYLHDFKLCPGIMLISDDNKIFIIYEINDKCIVKYIDGKNDILQALLESKFISDKYPFPINACGNINELEQYLTFNNLSKIFIDKYNKNYFIIDNCLVDNSYNVIQGTINSTHIINNNIQSISPKAFFALNLSDINIESNSIIKIHHNAFCNCFNLTKVALPNSIEYIDDDCFNTCINLTTINIPVKLTTLNNNVFRYCQSLQYLDIGQNVTEILNSFSYCINLQKITNVNIKCNISPLAFFECLKSQQDIIYYGNIN